MSNLWQLLSKLSQTASSSGNNFGNNIMLKGLGKYYESLGTNVEDARQFLLTVRAIAQCAMNLDIHLVSHNGKIHCLRRGYTQSLHISRQLVADIIAHSFFCLHIRKDFNFSNIYFDISSENNKMQKIQSEKLKCILQYFYCLRENDSAHYNYLSSRTIQFRRIALKQLLWSNLKQSSNQMGEFIEEKANTVENTPNKYAKVIFLKSTTMGANIFSKAPICRQEEIFILSCPELLVSFFLLEPLEDNEAIIISDFDRYVSCHGVDSNFSCGKINRKQHLAAIAINATNYRSDEQQQYTIDCMLKDFNKAFIGFTACRSESFNRNRRQYLSMQVKTNNKRPQIIRSHSVRGQTASRVSTAQEYSDQASSGQASFNHKSIAKTRQSFKEAMKSPVLATAAFTNTKFPTSLATGNWGCGELGGDPQLKVILQWIAMTEAGCVEMMYCTLDDSTLLEMGKVQNEMKKCSVGTLVQFLEDYSQYRSIPMHNSLSLFEYWAKRKKTKNDKDTKKCSLL